MNFAEAEVQDIIDWYDGPLIYTLMLGTQRYLAYIWGEDPEARTVDYLHMPLALEEKVEGNIRTFIKNHCPAKLVKMAYSGEQISCVDVLYLDFTELDLPHEDVSFSL